ncbi:hypothetical protein [Streptomyces spororaveus]|uniref:hypothetical protein n=1 Tax=Streptomyces spororaveus TaxID=284039 RepID=UPI0037B71BDD
MATLATGMMELTREQRELLRDELGAARAEYYDALLSSDPSDAVKEALAELLSDLKELRAERQQAG